MICRLAIALVLPGHFFVAGLAAATDACKISYDICMGHYRVLDARK
jgi:hypothetical protein